MSASLNREHKVGKGDTLDAIARKYGVKDSRLIWKASENRDLVAKRKDPQKILPGDVVIIPPGEKELKALNGRLAALQNERRSTQELLLAMQQEHKRIAGKLKSLDDLKAYSEKMTADIQADLERNLKDMKGWADGVDVAAIFVGLTVSLGTIVSKGFKAAGMSGAALQKLNKELLKDVYAMNRDTLREPIVKAVEVMTEKSGGTMEVVHILAESWGKMTSPSFWAAAAIKGWETKSYTQAMNVELGADIKDRMKFVAAQGDRDLKRIAQARASVESQQRDVQVLIKDCLAHLKWCDDQVRKLPQT